MQIRRIYRIASLCRIALFLTACSSPALATIQPASVSSSPNPHPSTASFTVTPSVTPTLVPPITLKLKEDWPMGADPVRTEFRLDNRDHLLGPVDFPGFPLAWPLHWQFEHDTAYLFLDVGGDTLHFNFGDGIWEAPALVGVERALRVMADDHPGKTVLRQDVSGEGIDYHPSMPQL